MNLWKLDGFLLTITIIVFALSVFEVFLTPMAVKIGLTGALSVVCFMLKRYAFGTIWSVFTIWGLAIFFGLIS